MTTDEITALREELEDALLQAFTDFHRLTGHHILHATSQFNECWPIDKPKPDAVLASVGLELS